MVMSESFGSNADSNDGFEKIWTIFSKTYQPVEFRSNLKLWSAAILAGSLWVVLGKIALGQFSSSQEFARSISSQVNKVKVENGRLSPEIEQKIQIIRQSNDMVASSAQNLYAFLTPIVTAVTGYFFVASSAPALRAQVNQNPPLQDPNRNP